MERRIIHSAAPVVAAPASVHCAVAFELHDALKESRTFAGLASAYSTPIDTYPERTIIEPGAFAASLANPEERSRVKVLWQHTDPIGRPTRIAESPKGLEVRATVSDTTLGRDAMTLLRDKVITEMSIGFDPIVWEFEERSGERFRVITKATL